jgi:ABC-type polysaccharide/polyol phosphate export permease
MAVFINAYRQVLLGGDFPKWSSLGIGVLLSLILFFVGKKIFSKLEKNFADVV